MLIGQRTELQSPFLRDGKRGPRRELHCAGRSAVLENSSGEWLSWPAPVLPTQLMARI